MALRINHNIAALDAWRNLNSTDRRVSNSMRKLSSGLKINRAADNPAGLAISRKMRSQISGLEKAIENSQTAISMIQTTEAALDEVQNMLITMRGLAIHSANQAVNDQTMLDADQLQIDKIIDTIDRIATNSQFGTMKLLNGFLSGSNQPVVSVSIVNNAQNVYSTIDPATDPRGISKMAVFQVGPDTEQSVSMSISSVTANMLGTLVKNGQTRLDSSLVANISEVRLNLTNVQSVSLSGSATATAIDYIYDSIRSISLSIGDISAIRAELGSFQAFTLESNLVNLRVAQQSLVEANSVLEDTDMAFEMSKFTKLQILMQAGVSMLAQANQIPQSVLQLLQ